MDHEVDNICKRCGKCCYYVFNGKLKKCKYLVKNGKLSSCRNYHSRLGRVIDIIGDKKIICVYRGEGLFDYKGCPYNKYRPMFEEMVKRNVK